jgi:hypothetical protein
MSSLQLKCQKCGRFSEPIHFELKEIFWRGEPSKKRYMQKIAKCAEVNGWTLIKGEPYCPECVKEILCKVEDEEADA